MREFLDGGLPMFPPATWNEQELLNFIQNGQEEFLELEFKRADSLSNTDPNKNEISKDVSAFANTIGGTIIYGIEEDRNSHRAVKLSPVNPAVTTKEWLEQVINSRIQPRIPGIQITPVRLSTPDSAVYVVTIPEGATAYQAFDQKYYKRGNFLSVPMFDYEIRQILNRVTRPCYKAWLHAWQWNSEMGQIVVAFKTTVVNGSEMTAHDPNAILYLPTTEFGLNPHDWELSVVNGKRYQKFVGAVGKLWYPGHPNLIMFDGARPRVDPRNPKAESARVLLRLFDHCGFALGAEYEIELPSLSLQLIDETSQRRPSPLNP
jgi:hypothetical protein